MKLKPDAPFVLEDAPKVVIAKMVDEDPAAPQTLTGLSSLLASLEPEAAQLKAAATMLLCFALSQMFTLHGFLGLVAAACVLFYAER